MSKLSFDEFNMPPTEKTFAKLIGRINQQTSKQLAAASLTQILWVAEFDGIIGDLYFVQQMLAGAGESMVLDVQKALVTAPTTFVTILSGTYTIIPASAAVGQQVSLKSLILAAQTGFKTGDIFQVIRTYVAGATPAPIGATQVVLEPSVKPYIY